MSHRLEYVQEMLDARWRRARTAFADGFRRRRGYLYATDRNGAGLDIIELHGKAKSIGMGQE